MTVIQQDQSEVEDIHLRQKIAPERDLFLILVLLVVLVVDVFALICLFAENNEAAAGFHLLACLIMAGGARLKDILEKDARFAWVCAIATPVMGPMAPIGVLFSLLWHYLSKEKSLSFREWRDSIFPPEHMTLAEIVYERITFGRDQAGEDYSITYLMDVLRLGSDEKKREAIFKISRHYDPRLAPLLKFALEDQHNVVRVQAATAITKLKNNFFTQSVRLEKRRRDWPKKNSILLELARHYDDYAFSGLLDDTQERENRQLSLEYYEGFLEREPKDSPVIREVRQLLGRLLFRMGRVEAACAQFEQLRLDGMDTPDINLWYGECLFHLKRYASLRQLAVENMHTALTTDAVKYPDNVRGTILLWAGAREETV